MNANAEVMRFLGRDETMSVAESDQALTRIVEHWAETGFGLWAAELLDTDEPIGFIGLAKPVFLPELLPAVEVGWRLRRQHWGRGYATEGARMALGQGFTTLGLGRILSITTHDNVRSQRVMEKLGITWDRAAVHPELGLILQVRAITRAAWEQSEHSPRDH